MHTIGGVGELLGGGERNPLQRLAQQKKIE